MSVFLQYNSDVSCLASHIETLYKVTEEVGQIVPTNGAVLLNRVCWRHQEHKVHDCSAAVWISFDTYLPITYQKHSIAKTYSLQQ